MIKRSTEAYMEAKDNRVLLWLNIDDCLKGNDPDHIGTPLQIAKVMVEKNVRSWMNSSSMDHGREYGFRVNNVRALVGDAMTHLLAEKKGKKA
ncbi:MAG: hypothetical protein LPK02_07350 [Rhodobacterales bacterium]|nr:hypothetical protein [Rhodobacterales bacterium]